MKPASQDSRLHGFCRIARQARVAIDTVNSQRPQTHTANTVIEKINARVAFVRALEDAVVSRGLARCALVEHRIVVVQTVDGSTACVDHVVDADRSRSFEDV